LQGGAKHSLPRTEGRGRAPAKRSESGARVFAVFALRRRRTKSEAFLESRSLGGGSGEGGPGTKLDELYECRGTSLMVSR